MPERGVRVFQEGVRLTFEPSGPTGDPVFVGRVPEDDWRLVDGKVAFDGCRYELTPGEFVQAARHGMWGTSVWSDRLERAGRPEAQGAKGTKRKGR